MEDNILHFGDAFEFMETMETGSVDMIKADPDFGIGKVSKKWAKGFDVDLMFHQFNRIVKPNGVIAIYSFGIFTADLINANRKYYKYSLIWEKDRTTGFLNAKKQPLRSHEDILIFYKKPPTYNPIMTEGINPHTVGKIAGYESSDNMCGKHIRQNTTTNMKYPRTVINFNAITGSKKLYPTQKPVELDNYLILTYTNEGDIVFDPYCGSGTTAVSSINTDRRYICCDRSEKAIKISEKRIASANEDKMLRESIKRLSQPMFS